MSLEEIKETFGNNELSYSTVSFSALANIMKFVNVKLQMDRQSFDYYYEINVDDLVRSDMPSDELEALKKQGWSLSNDNKILILFLRNN